MSPPTPSPLPSPTRRDALRLTAAAAAAALIPGCGSTPHAPPRAAGIIDTHTHFYDPGRKEGVPWPGKNDSFLYRPVYPAEYRTLTAGHGVTGTVVVEASPWLEDNQWVLDLAKDDPFLLGIVGNLVPGAPEFAGQLKRFAANRKFRGIRILHSLFKTGLARAEFIDDLRRLADAALELDVNGGPEMLPDVAKLAEKAPSLRIVINHLANLAIDGKAPPADWTRDMKAAAQHPKVYAKISGLVEGASQGGRKAPAEVAFYRPALDVVFNAFGEDRVIYGSNWPVSARFAAYAAVQNIVHEYVKPRGAAASEKLFYRNAKDAYRWA